MGRSAQRMVLFLFISIGLFFASLQEATAETVPYLIREGFQADPPGPHGVGGVYYYRFFGVPNVKGAKVMLSSTPDGKGPVSVGDQIQISGTYPTQDGNFLYPATVDCLHASEPLPAIDIRRYFPSYESYAQLSFLIRLTDWCVKPKIVSDLYLVVVTEDKGPEPFLDLPWEYEVKGLTFSEAALSINSYFDHEYPLLSSGLSESETTKQTIVNYLGIKNEEAYSTHDGYDYGRFAKANLGDPVLAAASGWATYVNSCIPCGNMILIDHENGYQTRYLHLQGDGLITTIPGERVWVEDRQQIGRVGATGNVLPHGDAGAHIHFGLVQDKNADGNFSDNIPDGMTDPFGWQSKEPDPWENYTFFYGGLERKGNKSYYLWKKPLDGMETTLTPSGGTFTSGKYTLTFPQGSTDQNVSLSLQASPLAQFTEQLVSVGTTLLVIEKNALGEGIHILLKPFTLLIDFSGFDVSHLKPETLSLFSSEDGKIWNKEETTVDLENKKATAKINHLTYFALMGERRDTIPPVTEAVLEGLEGEDRWFRSDVELSFKATDNEDGLGVDYTLYKKQGGDWEEYTEPLQYADEGEYKAAFYSVDNDGNDESEKTVSFGIDKTVPEVEIFYDIASQDFVFHGKDSSGSATVTQERQSRNKQTTIIRDKAGNTLTLTDVEQQSGQIGRLSLPTLQYNDQETIQLGRNMLTVLLYRDRNGIVQLFEQTYYVKGEVIMMLQYNAFTKKTRVITKVAGRDTQIAELDGIRILKLYTEKGTLYYSY